MSRCCEHEQDQDCECKETNGECGESCDCHDECGCGDNECHRNTCHCGGAGPCHGSHFQRRYQTKAEQIAELEGYLSELKLEVQAVEERLADLRK
jgi:hypothetical protein